MTVMTNGDVQATGPSQTPILGVSGRPSRVALVASDASGPSDAAVALGIALERELAFTPAIVSVLPPLPAVTPPLGGGIVVVPTDASLPAREARRRDELAHQLQDLGAPPDGWPTSIVVGVPSQEIEEAVHARNAALVVVGLHRHNALERLLHDDVALDVVRACSVPVVGVTRTHATLPARILVAMDFSRAAMRAARTAAAVARNGAELVLAHVAPPHDPRRHEDSEGAGLVRQLGMARAFEQLLRELPAGRALRYTPTVLEGDPANVVLDLASRMDAELIAVGTHRRTGVERFFLGSVTQALMLDARCSVLSAHGDLSR